MKADAVRKQLLEKLGSRFIDPITGYSAANEVQLSGLLGLYHQMGWVDWSNVPLWLLSNEQSGKMAHELLAETTVCGEYQLFWKTAKERDLVGGMPADLLFLSKNSQRVVLLEHKIRAPLSRDVAAGQLARQVDFLSRCRIPLRFLVLLSSKEFFDMGWYLEECIGTFRHSDRSEKVIGFLMRWEDVLSATNPLE